MKIGLFTQHEGLLRMVCRLWEDHEVRLHQAKPWWEKELGILPFQGDEDIIVSAAGYHELNWLRTEKPVIAYVTHGMDPSTRAFVFTYWLEQENFIAIGLADCIPPETIMPLSGFILGAMGGYPSYNGRINKVLVVNRKPDERLMYISRAALQHEPDIEDKMYDVAKMMGDLPYTIAHESNRKKFEQMYADYKVLFYFSHSPFTAVMYEAMAVGIPVVAYNSVGWGTTSEIEKWFPKRSIYPDEIRKMLREELDRTPPSQPIDYGNPSFDEIKQKWNDLFGKCQKDENHR